MSYGRRGCRLRCCDSPLKPEQHRPELDAVVIGERRLSLNFLAVDERAVAAPHVFDRIAVNGLHNLGVLARYHVRVDLKRAFRMTPDDRLIDRQLERNRLTFLE